jgi:CRP-like cAMP-binding protein
MEKIGEFLQTAELFSELDLHYCRKIAENSPLVHFDEDHILFIEGDEGSSFYVVYSGSVELFRTTKDAKDIVIKSVEKGELFGEIILFEGNTYPVSARVKEKTTLISINRTLIHGLLDDSHFRDELFAALFGKIRMLAKRILFLSTMDVYERFLVYIIKNYGKKNEYEITEQKKVIAREIGTIPETFSRMVKKLKKQGLRWENNSLTIPDTIWKEFEETRE